MRFLGTANGGCTTSCIPVPLIDLENQCGDLRGCIELKLYPDGTFDLKYYYMGSSDMGHLQINQCYSPTTNSHGSSLLRRLTRPLRLEYQDTQACDRLYMRTHQCLQFSNLYWGC
jgi:hypothetical protein